MHLKLGKNPTSAEVYRLLEKPSACRQALWKGTVSEGNGCGGGYFIFLLCKKASVSINWWHSIL